MDKASEDEIAALLAAGGMAVVEPLAGMPRLSAQPLIDSEAPKGGPGGAAAAAAAAEKSHDPLRDKLELAGKSGKLGYKAGVPFAFDFRTPGEMFLYFHPELTPHEWQLEEQHRLGGYLALENPETCEAARPTKAQPLYYNLVAANGSGKDTYVISPTAMWFVSAKIRSRCIVTSASQDQLKLQTFNYITNYAERVNAQLGYQVYDIREFYIYNNLTGSELIGRVTNDPGKVEGFHPFPSPNDAEMCVIINEAKSITDDVFASFSRFTGYNYWLQVSSPGTKTGQFYRTCYDARMDKCELGAQFMRRVTAFECPNISPTHIEQVKKIHGEDSLIYRTSILAEFYSSEVDVVIPESLLAYPTPARDTFGLEPAAGLDIAFSLSGDATQWSCWHGNHEIHRAEIKTDNADRLHNWIIQQITHCTAKFKLRPSAVYADGGGLGAPIISRVCEAGYPITTRKNEYQAFNRMYYENLGAEMWFRVKRLFQQRVLVQPSDDVARKQLTERKGELNAGSQKYRLEQKQKHKQRLGYSPDRADSIVLALSGYPIDTLLSRPPQAAQNALMGKHTDEELRKIFADYAFNNIEPRRIGTAAVIRGLNHEHILKYAQR